MDINYIKSYLKVDYDDDNLLIESMYNACIAYLEPILVNAVGVYNTVLYENFYEYWKDVNDKRINLVDLYILAMIKEIYDNRGLVSTDRAAEKIKYTMSHILNELQYS